MPRTYEKLLIYAKIVVVQFHLSNWNSKLPSIVLKLSADVTATVTLKVFKIYALLKQIEPYKYPKKMRRT